MQLLLQIDGDLLNTTQPFDGDFVDIFYLVTAAVLTLVEVQKKTLRSIGLS